MSKPGSHRCKVSGRWLPGCADEASLRQQGVGLEAPTPLSPRPQDEGEEKVWTLEEIVETLTAIWNEATPRMNESLPHWLRDDDAE